MRVCVNNYKWAYKKKDNDTGGLAEPVLDAFTDDEEVGLEEALDDLAVSLFSHSQFAGYGCTLAKVDPSKTIECILQVFTHYKLRVILSKIDHFKCKLRI